MELGDIVAPQDDVMAGSSPSVLLASFCIHAGRSFKYRVPCTPTGTPQGYTTLSPHPYPMMRMLPLILVRGTFGQAHLWSTLLASFLVGGSPAILKDIVKQLHIWIVHSRNLIWIIWTSKNSSVIVKSLLH